MISCTFDEFLESRIKPNSMPIWKSLETESTKYSGYHSVRNELMHLYVCNHHFDQHAYVLEYLMLCGYICVSLSLSLYIYIYTWLCLIIYVIPLVTPCIGSHRCAIQDHVDTHRTYILTHCGLVAPFGDIDLGQHWLWWWLYLNQCWILINETLWHSLESDFRTSAM